MRLTAIKLAGFKSFVDPTTFFAPSNLTGVVGPNGCGKSNIIDAIRWVMGEGSAKVLRGESMADVIFNGSTNRKPVGTATVELIFDNSDGRVAGEFAQFNEISVRRTVSRDGQSQYFLNGTRCRRKDITDLFLGTGLGSRSYSIIEQGMISQIVEARPEDVRAHLEEAAGISKYKERRRDTENRIRRTRENLERLSDLREEVGKHIEKLKRQARAAERYKQYKQEKRDLESRLLALRWQDLSSRAETSSSELNQQETRLESLMAEVRSSETALEKLREQQGESSTAFSGVQGELYEIGGQIARLEQTIQHARELQTRQESEFEETQAALQDLEKHIVLDKAQVEDLTQAIAALEPEVSTAQAAEQTAQDRLDAAEREVSIWQDRFDRHHADANEQARNAEAKRAQIEHLDQRIGQAASRLEALSQESSELEQGGSEQDLAELEQRCTTLQQAEQSAQTALDAMRQDVAQLRKQLDTDQQQLTQAQREVHQTEGRLASLQALQQAALDKQQLDENWLQRSGLKNQPQLANQLQVQPGWEAATETVLNQWLDGVVSEPSTQALDSLASLERGSLLLLAPGTGRIAAKSGSLAEFVRGPDAVLHILNQVKVAKTLAEALQQRDQLSDDESVITANGEWLGRDWVRVVRGGDDVEAGVLARKQELEKLEVRLQQQQDSVAELEQKIQRGVDQVETKEQQRDEQQEQVNRSHRQYSEAHSRLSARQARLQQLEQRHTHIAKEAAELKQQLSLDEDAVRGARGLMETVLSAMAALETDRGELDSGRAALLQQRDGLRAELRGARETHHATALKTEAKRASLDSLRQSLTRMDTQLTQLQERYVNLSEQLARNEDPEKTHQAEMNRLLESRVETEQRLAKARQDLQQLEHDYREQDGKRQKAVNGAEALRGELEQARLKQQELKISARNIADQIGELGYQVETLVAELPEDANLEAWQNQVDKLQSKIQRLEPVNLAAIQEFEEEQKRKAYLDAQNDDLNEALATLEAAIDKIDRKTRTRFKETFELVNKGVQELFPRLFGGGHAYLELTGNDLLTTGVAIMARPPGKRVSSIHLLSGGEKALTAVAFVFSIFRLNPAPFCLLDEVDAPLDDANVGRFCELVQEMAENVQFVIVTHNKITMEMAHQLSGVTMREPGVSRLVQVDIDEAAKLVGT